MAKRQVFYSFHYKNDVMRAQLVRNMGVVEGNTPVSPNTWEAVKDINEPSAQGWCAGLAFHPKEPILATLGKQDTVVRVWSLDIDALLSRHSAG